MGFSFTDVFTPRFGNYIGEAEESDESQHGDVRPSTFTYDEESEEGEEEIADDQQLMEVDGR